MAYTLDIDAPARAQISALPPTALTELVDAFEVLTLVPGRGAPWNARNPTGGVYQLMFGKDRGLITYLVLEDQHRVDVLHVTWLDA